MKYYPNKKDEILAKRVESELKHRTYRPNPQNTCPVEKLPTPLDLRLKKLRKMKEEKRSRLSFIDEFLDSEENQKKYGFTTDVVDGIRSIYYDGDIEVLNEAMYGSSVRDIDTNIDTERTMRLSESNSHLYARFPHKNEDIPVKIRIGIYDTSVPNFSIVLEKDDVTLTQLCLIEPAYFPDDSACRYLIDMKGLSVLNRYVRNNYHHLIEEWNRLHPSYLLEYDLSLPNYRFLASTAYMQSKVKNKIQ